MYKKYLLFLSLSSAAMLCGAEISRKGNLYELKTRDLVISVDPSSGGRVVRCLDIRSGNELARNYDASLAPAGCGFFADRLWMANNTQVRDLERSPYRVISTSSDKNQAQIVLEKQLPLLKIRKTIRLREGKRRVLCSYELSNPGETDFTGRFWSTNSVTPAGKKWRFYLPEGMCSDDPGKNEVKKALHFVDYDLAHPVVGNYFVNRSPRDFLAVSGTGGSGAALVADYRFQDWLYCFVPPEGGAQLPTLEWMTSLMRIQPLSKGKAEAHLHPELADPLQDYIIRFTMQIVPFSVFDHAKFRPGSPEKKITRFIPVIRSEKAHLQFRGSFVPWFSTQKEQIRLLFIGDHYNSSAFFDFSRRINSHAEAVENWRAGNITRTQYAGYMIPDPEEMLEKELNRDPHVIIIPTLARGVVNAKLKALLYRKVEAGATVIYIAGESLWQELVPVSGGKLLPENFWNGLPFRVQVREFSRGKGRIFHVPFRLHHTGRLWNRVRAMCPLDNVPGAENKEDYFAFYCKLIRYARNCSAPAKITKAVRSGSKIHVTIQADAPCNAALNQWQGKLAAGSNTVTIPVPENSLRRVNLLLSADQKAADIFILTMPEKQQIRKLETDQQSYEPDQSVTGTVTFDGTCDVELFLADAGERILAHRRYKHVPQTAAFSLTPKFDGVNSLLKLTAKIIIDGKVTDCKTLSLTRRTPDTTRLKRILWTLTGTGINAGKLMRQSADMGFTHLMGGDADTLSAEDVRNSNIAHLESGVHLIGTSLYRFAVREPGKQGKIRPRCLRDPETHQLIRRKTRTNAEKMAPFFPVYYCSADENSLGDYSQAHDFCFSEHCLKAFRKHLKTRYRSIRALNQVWKSNFASFDQVVPLTRIQAQQQNNFVPFIEHRRFMLGAITDGAKIMQNELLKVDKQAVLSHSGQALATPGDCWNWLENCKIFRASSLYGDAGLPDFIRSAFPGNTAGRWNGYSAPLAKIRLNSFNDLADGLFGLSYWYLPLLLRRGDNLPNAAGIHMQNLNHEIDRSGIDPLMTTGVRRKSPFTMIYSPDNVIAAECTGSTSIFSPQLYNQNISSWAWLIRNAGFPAPQIIGDDRICTLDPEKHPAVILPMLQLISGKNIAHLEQYVKHGGILIIDAQAGIMDDYGAFRSDNPLDRLAGVKAQRASGSGGGSVEFKQRSIRLNTTGAKVESTGAKALGAVTLQVKGSSFGGISIGSVHKKSSGAFYLNTCGRGKVIYLNALVNNYAQLQHDPAGALPVLNTFRELFARVGLQPGLPAVPGLNHAQYDNGIFKSILLVNNRNTPVSVPLDLGKAYHVFETVSGTGMSGRKMTASLDAAGVAMYIMTEKKPEPPVFRCTLDGTRIQLHAKASPGGILRMELFRNGKRIHLLCRNEMFRENGKWQFELGLMPRGNYTLKVFDILSRKTYKKEFKFK